MNRICVAVAALTMWAAAAEAGHENTHICQIASEADFYASVAHRKPKVFLANDKARNTILDAVNADRKAKGMFLIEADTFVIGHFIDSGMTYVGLVAFKDRCVVPGTVAVMDARQWVSFMLVVGVTANDFTEMRDG